ncbi:phosphotransferase family protein [Bacillus marinisedimentorum]|uniref:phosphotransferase family protein n=1 Tax=Bacillus marinisedimentorum TaxID=1821260 RepID=UPI0008731EB5|nr:aminoglycoside phosphotransferase family protein [Bacillus marinisedimentorum]
MKAGWERSHDLIMPDIKTAGIILKPFLKEKRINQIEPLSGGLNNSNLKITTNTDENYVLRIYSNNNKSMDIERKILNLLKDVIPVPQVIYNDSSCSVFKYPFLILSWVQGVQLSEILYRRNKKEIACAANEVGKFLAEIHKNKFPFPGFFDEDLGIQEFIKLDANKFLMYIEDSLAKGHAAKHLGVDLSSELWKFSNDHAYLIDHIGEQNSLVHSDFNPLNILVNERESKVNITGILDWEFAFSGSHLIDIGNMLRYENATDPEFLNPFISSYQDNGGFLPAKWLQKARLLDLIALCGLLNKKECGEVRVNDIQGLIFNTMEEWDKYGSVQANFV